MPYVIKTTLRWKKKDGTDATMESYFRECNGVFISLASIEDAKKYDYITEARRDKRKYLLGRNNYTIIKIT